MYQMATRQQQGGGCGRGCVPSCAEYGNKLILTGDVHEQPINVRNLDNYL